MRVEHTKGGWLLSLALISCNPPGHANDAQVEESAACGLDCRAGDDATAPFSDAQCERGACPQERADADLALPRLDAASTPSADAQQPGGDAGVEAAVEPGDDASAFDAGPTMDATADATFDAHSSMDAADDAGLDAQSTMDGAPSSDATATQDAQSDALADSGDSEAESDAAQPPGSCPISAATSAAWITPPDAGCNAGAFVVRGGGTGYDRAEAVALGPDGISYVSGHFSGSAKFGSVVLTSAGADDVFLAKYAADGSVLWARSAGGPQSDQAYAVAALPAGGVAIAGYAGADARFADTVAPTYTSPALFVATYDASGQLLWLRTAGGVGGGAASKLVAGPDGSLYVAGSLAGSWSFDGTPVLAVGDADMFVAKYDPSGNLRWVRRAGGPRSTEGRGLAVAADGSAYVTGQFRESTRFGTIQLTAPGSAMFLAKYGCDGTILWAVRPTSSEYLLSHGWAATVARDGSVYVTGRNSGDTSTGAHYEDMFLAKFTPSGELLWAQAPERSPTIGFGGSVGLGIAMNGDDAIYVTGGYYQTVKFGDTTFGIEPAHYLQWSLFLTKYNSDGVVQWARQAQQRGDSIAFNYGRGIAIQPGCAVHITGGFTQDWSYGSQSFRSLGDEDVFLIRHAP